ncbi:hypothetical protein F5Y16DRAFT_377743 [Xylariaceae sp. FL0255]|nr:hypothetical protein F5Y16DRAFT_377743 [Xylariaceae sp. FL0255]
MSTRPTYSLSHATSIGFIANSRAQQRIAADALLQLSETWTNKLQELLGKRPTFSSRLVQFGFEEDKGVVVAALVPDTHVIAYWGFGDMFASNEPIAGKHYVDESSDPQASFGLMAFDLQAAA